MPETSKIQSERQSVHCDPVLSTPKKQLNFEHFPEANKDLQSCDASSSEYKMTSSPFVHSACNDADANNSNPLNIEGFDENYSSSHDADDSDSSPLSPEGFDDNQFNLNTSFDTSDSLSECGMSDNEKESFLSDSSSEEDTVSSSESSIDTDLKTDEDIPVKEFQSLSLLSCFLRNKFSASSSQDVLQTIKDTFKECKDIARLDFNEMMTYAGTTPAREIHYCILCNEIFPENEDIFQCSTLNCEGLRYKGSLSSQQIKSRQPKQSFVFSDMKLLLKDLLQTQGIALAYLFSYLSKLFLHFGSIDMQNVQNTSYFQYMLLYESQWRSCYNMHPLNLFLMKIYIRLCKMSN